MFREALEYPTRSEDRVREYGIGVLLSLGSIFIIPFFILLGYYKKALTQSLNEEQKIPVFKNFPKLLVDGLKFFGIMISYMFLPIIAISLVETAGLTGSLGSAITGTLFFIFLTALYLIPSALSRFAKEDRMRSGYNISEVGRTAFTSEYFKGVLILIGTALLIGTAQLAVMLALILTIIGIPTLLIALPAMQLYENLVYTRIIAEMTR